MGHERGNILTTGASSNKSLGNAGTQTMTLCVLRVSVSKPRGRSCQYGTKIDTGRHRPFESLSSRRPWAQSNVSADGRKLVLYCNRDELSRFRRNGRAACDMPPAVLNTNGDDRKRGCFWQMHHDKTPPPGRRTRRPFFVSIADETRARAD